MAKGRPSSAQTVAAQLLQMIPSRQQGFARLRTIIANTGGDDQWRPLGQSSAHFYRLQQTRLARANVALASAMFADGDSVSGARALDIAVGESWNTAALERQASLRLARKDTAAATRSFAMLLADPSRQAAFNDTVRQRTGRFYSATVGQKWRDSGTVLLRSYLLGGLKPVVPTGPLRAVKRDDGSMVNVVRRRESVLISFWSSGCAPSLEELPSLAGVQSQLAARGLSLLLVSRNSTAPLRPKANDLAGLVFAADADGAMHRAMRQWMSPQRYLTVPGSSRIWEVELPLAELPLLAASLHGGTLLGGSLP
jgi:hypothetical protein